jgi:SPP1 family predicted phage head-tail adaptor
MACKTKAICAGRLTKRLKIEKFTASSTDGRGQSSGSWSTDGYIYGEIQTLGGRQAEYAHQVYDEATHIITTRYTSRIDKTNRLVYQSTTFDIGHVENVNMDNVELRLYCSEAK